MPTQRQKADTGPDRRAVRSPLDDYRAARRDGAFVATAERLSRDAVLAHCECDNCAARRRG
ncbi:hypothetical protein [Kitasatospora sp. NPDC047058]|uniref:hypothetical protein n=1 Tax=Kitasatospora sp. NPDC047058 TaxID=3155620 RepID=UPI0033C2DA60